MTYVRPAVRAFALAGLTALALVPAACGGSDDDGDATGAQATKTEVKSEVKVAPGAAKTSEQQELLATHEEMLTALKAGDASTYCEGLTSESRIAVPKYLGGRPCEEMVRSFAANPGRAAGFDRKVVKIEIKGDKGTVASRRTSGGAPEYARYERVDDEWLANVVPAFAPGAKP